MRLGTDPRVPRGSRGEVGVGSGGPLSLLLGPSRRLRPNPLRSPLRAALLMDRRVPWAARHRLPWVLLLNELAEAPPVRLAAPGCEPPSPVAGVTERLREALGGYLFPGADDFDVAIELASKIPAARMGGSVGVRPLKEQ